MKPAPPDGKTSPAAGEAAIAAFAAWLSAIPGTCLQRDGEGFVIDPPNEGGFGIRLAADGDQWLVCFGDRLFHEGFSDVAAALDLVAFGLSPRCRLREVTAPLLRRSIVEQCENGVWRMVYEVGAPGWPLPLSAREFIFRNTLLAE